MSDILEVKGLVEKIGTTFEEYKRTNDAMLAKAAKGESVAELENKLSKIDADLQKFTEAKSQIDAFILKQTSPGADTKESGDLREEVKAFNLQLRADLQGKGKPITGEIGVEEYKAYKSGFLKTCAGVKFEQLSEPERKALSAGSDPDGGYLLPSSTTGRVVAKVYDKSVMRQICNVQTISTNKLPGLIDNDEASAGWVSELGTRSDSDTPQVGKWEIEAFELYAMPKASQTILDDAAIDLESWLAAKVADKIARVEGAAFWEGTGSGQARGLATYTTAATADSSRAWGQMEHVLSGASADFHTTDFDPVVEMVSAFKNEYLPNASFVMRRSVLSKARKLKESTTDRYLWEPGMQVGSPDKLMGYPVRIDEYMPALASGSLSLAFGDFREAYTIVDRIGIRTLRDPFTAKPYVVFYTTKRTGGGCVNFEAVKFIKFSA